MGCLITPPPKKKEEEEEKCEIQVSIFLCRKRNLAETTRNYSGKKYAEIRETLPDQFFT